MLDVARRDVDDSMLRTISEADYGVGVEDYLAELRTIRDTGALPVTLKSSEVLTLATFSEPNDQALELGGSSERGHRTRAFACAVVLRAEFEGCGVGIAETALAQCLTSARLLGEELNAAIGSFLTWAMPLVGNGDRRLFALGMLIAAPAFVQEC